MTVDYGNNPNNPHWVREDPELQAQIGTEFLEQSTEKLLNDIVAGKRVIRGPEDNFIKIDPNLKPGETASKIVSASASHRRQAIAITQNYRTRANEKLASMDGRLKKLKELHNKAIFTPSEEMRDLILEIPDNLELIGSFAMRLDEHFELKTDDEVSFTSKLMNAIDVNDGKKIEMFISAARTNASNIATAYDRQEAEFGYFLNGLLQHSQQDTPQNKKGSTQDPHVKNARSHEDGPGRYDTN